MPADEDNIKVIVKADFVVVEFPRVLDTMKFPAARAREFGELLIMTADIVEATSDSSQKG